MSITLGELALLLCEVDCDAQNDSGILSIPRFNTLKITNKESVWKIGR